MNLFPIVGSNVNLRVVSMALCCSLFSRCILAPPLHIWIAFSSSIYISFFTTKSHFKAPILLGFVTVTTCEEFILLFVGVCS